MTATRRTPIDGKPYYCQCGKAFEDYLDCMSNACQLEDRNTAEVRRIRTTQAFDELKPNRKRAA